MMLDLTDGEQEQLRPFYAAEAAAEARYKRAMTEVQEARGLDDARRESAEAELVAATPSLTEATAAREAAERAILANRKAAK